MTLMIVTLQTASDLTADNLIAEILQQANLSGEDTIDVVAPAHALPYLAAAAAAVPNLPDGFRLHEADTETVPLAS